MAKAQPRPACWLDPLFKAEYAAPHLKAKLGCTVLNRLYLWTMSQAQAPYALWLLLVVSFAESSFFPIPPDVLLIPLILAAPQRAFLIAGLCTIASVLGGGFGYYIGAQLFETMGQPILEFYNKFDKFEAFKTRFNEQGHWAVLFAGVTIFPYKVITITSGVTGLPFGQFMLWSLVARSIRFFLVAWLLWKYGTTIRDFIERRLALLTTIFMVLLIAGFFLVKVI